jgi:hypothetical protein
MLLKHVESDQFVVFDCISLKTILICACSLDATNSPASTVK